MTKKRVIVFVFLTLFSFIFARYNANADFDCLTLTPASAQADKDYCRNELAGIETQLQVLLNQQKEQQKTTGTLKGDVDYLTSQINALKTKIKARSLAITQLKVNIAEKASTIKSLSQKIDREHESLAQLLRNTNEFDEQTTVHLIFSDNSISDFYSDLESYESIKQAVKASVDLINNVKAQTEIVKSDLEKEHDAETDAKEELESAQKKVAQSESEKRILLNLSKNKESEYQKLAAAKKVQADKIRSALFPLAGTSQKIDFGTALAYAQDVQKKLGVDPAFLLAVITKESNLGANVGQCYLTNLDTGAGVGKNTGTIFPNVMKPSRDVGPFLEITKELGLDPFKTIVSCPIVSKNYWNSGSIGPAQFLPSTWKLFVNRLQNLLGYYANPWSPADSFLASGMYLGDLGGTGKSASAQSKAACRYNGLSGNSCSYSRGVMKLKQKIQSDIDLLN